MPVYPPSLSPDEFRHVGILLLGHHAASGAKRIGQLDKVKFLRRPDDQFFAEPGQVHHKKRQGPDDFDHEVAVRHGIQTILRNGRKIEQRCRHLPIDRIVGSGQGAGTERHDIKSCPGILEAPFVAL
jgi:hypothetical protein